VLPVCCIITLNKTTLTLEKDKTEQLTLSITPENVLDKNIQWTSSDESVATVSANGIVTAVSQGTSTITAITIDGGGVATCEVAVVPARSVAIEDLRQATNTLKVYPNRTSVKYILTTLLFILVVFCFCVINLNSKNMSEQYYCKWCGKKFSSVRTLSQINCNRNPEGKTHALYEGDKKDTYTCKYCGIKNSNMMSLTNHPCKNSPSKRCSPALL
jgi:DNA-directed RNA polymerase subunit RPC12/RpoP